MTHEHVDLPAEGRSTLNIAFVLTTKRNLKTLVSFIISLALVFSSVESVSASASVLCPMVAKWSVDESGGELKSKEAHAKADHCQSVSKKGDALPSFVPGCDPADSEHPHFSDGTDKSQHDCESSCNNASCAGSSPILISAYFQGLRVSDTTGPALFRIGTPSRLIDLPLRPPLVG